MTALYSLAEIRAVEHAAQAGLPPGALMQRAGAAATDLALRLLPAGGPQRVLVLAGPGNNGGDALDMAARLATACEVGILLFADPGRLPADAAQALQRARQSDAEFLDTAQALPLLAQSRPLVVDGLFGISLSRAIAGGMREVVKAVNRSKSLVLALDIPSGLDAHKGTVVGEDGVAIAADHTITFIGDKPGLHTCDGRDHAGAVTVAGLDIDATLFPQPRAQLNGPELFSLALQPRRHNTHKGSYGDVAIIGGATGMAGATLLAARAAAKCGAGRTYAVFVGDPPALDHEQPELMCRRADDFAFGNSTLVVGPGLGQSESARALLQCVLEGVSPLILDADALNLIAATPTWQKELAQRPTLPILTPHPLEAARLLG
ncbi:MAG: NAD(P)H-hydrate epimerase, partial [Burkholderiaceae bacterium]|nr:NAD(P)H-hydrate epimerase [Burkholderiaceae bacterium]